MKVQSYLAGVAAMTSLFQAAAAEAQQGPCREGDYGIVYPQVPCSPAEVATDNADAADAAVFLDENDEVAPAPVAEVAPAPAPVYQFEPGIVATAPERGASGRQIGVRASSLYFDDTFFSTAGVYRRWGGEKLALEVEGFMGTSEFRVTAGATASVLRYRTISTRTRLYGLAGLGFIATDDDFTGGESHVGIGADYRLGRVTLSADMRAGVAVDHGDDQGLFFSNVGISWDRNRRIASALVGRQTWAGPVAPVVPRRRLFSAPPVASGANSGREIGVRGSMVGEYGDDVGLGAYYRSHNGHRAFELSVDGMLTETDIPIGIPELSNAPRYADLWVGMASMMRYLNPNGVIRVYGTGGLGLDASADLGTLGIAAQAGVGADMNLGPRYVLNTEARMLFLDPLGESVVIDSLPIVSVGIARRR